MLDGLNSAIESTPSAYAGTSNDATIHFADEVGLNGPGSGKIANKLTIDDGRESGRQVVFLSLDGAQDVDYFGPVTVEGIHIPAFAAPGMFAGQEADVLRTLTWTLSQSPLGANTVFTTARPQDGEFSTVYIGGSGADFAPWGDYYGLAQDVDVGNQNRSDIAFVFSDNIPALDLTATEFGQRLASIVVHETGHLLGLGHAHDDGDDPLAGVAF